MNRYRKNITLSERLQLRSKDAENGCRVWQGAVNTAGYGHLKTGGRYLDTHRAAWIAKHGEIPDGLWVLHKCDNPPCINPDHLFLGTHQDNCDDKVDKGRQIRGKKQSGILKKVVRRGDRHRNSKLTYEKVFEMRWLEAMGRTHTSLAKEYGVSQSVASDAITGRSWQFELHD